MNKLILIVSIFIFLIGCTDAKVVVPFQEYESAIEDEIVENENDQIGIGEPLKNIDIFGESSNVAGLRTVYCWDEGMTSDCTLSPENPRERTLSERALIVNEGEEIQIHVAHSYEDTISPQQVEIIQYRSNDEEGEIIESETISRTVKFSAPVEKGAFFYLVHVVWNEDYSKEVYYVFRTVVR